MEDIVLLEYLFMFKPSDTWSQLYEFEQSFASYLESIGFEGNFVKSIKGGSSRNVLIITKKESKLPTEEKEVKKVKKESKIKSDTVGGAFKELRKKTGFKEKKKRRKHG